tara:strand:+ start:215 stop:592 length:378 start_codon:yes stop_codon:yes gene_type:complete
MKIEDINNSMGELTQEILKQFQTEFMRLAETEEGLLGLMHEIAENPEMYFSMLGQKIVYLASAYNEAVNSYMSLDEILTDEWCESMPSPVGPEFGEGPPTITPDVLRFPDKTIDPFDYPNGDRTP